MSHLAGSSPAAPVRNRYFFGKMLDVRHLEMEQAYFVEHRRRLNRLTVGNGVVCGLEVTVGADGKAICIAPGFAIDGFGREIVVTETICVPDPSAVTDACGRPAGTAQEGAVTLCLAYHECDTDPSPVLVDDCDVREGCAAGAVRERCMVLVHDGLPTEPPYPDIAPVCRLVARLAAGLGAAGPPLIGPAPVHAQPPPGVMTTFSCAPPDESCVVLATVTLPTDQQPEPVPDYRFRRTVLSNDQLLEAILCLAAAVGRAAGRGLKLAVVSGDAQTGEPGHALAEPIVVEVTGADGNPVKGESVDFTVTSALQGSFDPPTVATDEAGRARTVWTLGTAGGQTAVATLSDGTAQAPITATAQE